MKKMFTLFLVMFLSLSSFSQEHLDFRGVPIDGHLDEFVAKMETMGYTIKKKGGNIVVMAGQFTNRDVALYVVGSRQTKTVWQVIVNFDECSSWSSLKNSYFEYKDLYIKKYGPAKHTYEFFCDLYYEGDGYELQALRKEKCFYYSFFETVSGMIKVGLSKFENLQIVYEDKINADKHSQEKTASVLDEI